jgi:hypothetical protein
MNVLIYELARSNFRVFYLSIYSALNFGNLNIRNKKPVILKLLRTRLERKCKIYGSSGAGDGFQMMQARAPRGMGPGIYINII